MLKQKLSKEKYATFLGDLQFKGFSRIRNNGGGFTQPLLLSLYPLYNYMQFSAMHLECRTVRNMLLSHSRKPTSCSQVII